MMAERLPRELIGNWEILACLKASSSRQCLLTRDETGRQGVLKWSLDRGEDLEGEARMLGQMDCPDLPTVYASGREEGCSWLLREYIPGETLLDYAQKRGPLPAEETARTREDVFAALSEQFNTIS